MENIDYEKWTILLGGWSGALYLVFKFIIPGLNANKQHSHLGASVYENARDTIARLEAKVKEMETQNEQLRDRVRELEIEALTRELRGTENDN